MATCSAGRLANSTRRLSVFFVLHVDVVFVGGAVGFPDANHQRQSEGRGRQTDHDGREDQHVWQRVGVDADAFLNDRGRAAPQCNTSILTGSAYGWLTLAKSTKNQ